MAKIFFSFLKPISMYVAGGTDVYFFTFFRPWRVKGRTFDQTHVLSHFFRKGPFNTLIITFCLWTWQWSKCEDQPLSEFQPHRRVPRTPTFCLWTWHWLEAPTTRKLRAIYLNMDQEPATIEEHRTKYDDS